jgi:hypothetical protein
MNVLTKPNSHSQTSHTVAEQLIHRHVLPVNQVFRIAAKIDQNVKTGKYGKLHSNIRAKFPGIMPCKWKNNLFSMIWRGNIRPLASCSAAAIDL